jgi:hypothetical protein
LFTLALLVDLFSLGGALWLSVYIATRGSRSLRAWLAALALLFLSFFFLRNALVLYRPGDLLLYRLRLVGMLGLTFWFHLLTLLLPGPRGVLRAGLVGAYGLGALLILQHVLFPGPPPAGDASPVYLLGRATQRASPYLAAYITAVGGLALFYLWRAWVQAPTPWLRRLITSMLLVTLPAVLAGLYLALGPRRFPSWPAFPADAVLGASVILLGYNVARYDALVEGRTIERDALYSLIGTGLVLGLYGLVLLGLLWSGQASVLGVVLILVTALLSHALYDGGRSALDRLFYRGQRRRLRANLRALAREAGSDQALGDQLRTTLAALCRAFQIQGGFIALRQADGFIVHAAERASHPDQAFALAAFEASETEGLPRAGAESPPGMALLIPLSAGGSQLGALVLGTKASGQPYSEADLDLLEEIADQVAAVLYAWRLQDESARAINRTVDDFRQRERALQRQLLHLLAERETAALDHPGQAAPGEDGFVSQVEACLRRLHDFAFLGEHRLARLSVVSARLSDMAGAAVTHLDRGKALQGVLLEALDKLRPATALPAAGAVPGREWHLFIILHDAYVQEELTRTIMGRLNISEPTLHRARRRAVRSVARALQEMEAEAATKMRLPAGTDSF